MAMVDAFYISIRKDLTLGILFRGPFDGGFAVESKVSTSSTSYHLCRITLAQHFRTKPVFQEFCTKGNFTSCLPVWLLLGGNESYWIAIR